LKFDGMMEDKITLVKMSVDKVTVQEMPADKKFCSQNDSENDLM
jgi:hypothetical protein